MSQTQTSNQTKPNQTPAFEGVLSRLGITFEVLEEIVWDVFESREHITVDPNKDLVKALDYVTECSEYILGTGSDEVEYEDDVVKVTEEFATDKLMCDDFDVDVKMRRKLIEVKGSKKLIIPLRIYRINITLKGGRK